MEGQTFLRDRNARSGAAAILSRCVILPGGLPSASLSGERITFGVERGPFSPVPPTLLELPFALLRAIVLRHEVRTTLGRRHALRAFLKALGREGRPLLRPTGHWHILHVSTPLFRRPFWDTTVWISLT